MKRRSEKTAADTDALQMLKLRSTRSLRRTGAFLFSALAVSVFLCSEMMAQQNTPGPQRDINEVLRAHDKELLAIPNVVGVYVGVLEDGKTACLKVMVAQKSAETERAIPKSLEGFSVIIEVTGEIRPLGN